MSLLGVKLCGCNVRNTQTAVRLNGRAMYGTLNLLKKFPNALAMNTLKNFMPQNDLKMERFTMHVKSI